MTIVGYKNYFLWVIENYCGIKMEPHITVYGAIFLESSFTHVHVVFYSEKKKNQINEFLYLVARYFLVT